MVGTRSGISTTSSCTKEKTKMRTKDVEEKGLVPESIKHGVRARGMRLSNRTDSKAGGAIVGSSVPRENPSLTTVRKTMIKKSALTITDITGDVSSSSSSGERTDDRTVVSEEVLADMSPLESRMF